VDVFGPTGRDTPGTNGRLAPLIPVILVDLDDIAPHTPGDLAQLAFLIGRGPAQQRDRTDELVAELRARLEDMRNERDRARADADTWRTAFERELAQRALPAPGNVARAPETTPATPDGQPRTSMRPVPLVSQPDAQPSRCRRAWRWMRAAR
jgi:hypothetical protein